MNWNKAKTILIVFFLVSNVFLLSMILMRSLNEFYINKDTVVNTVAILENNGVKIDKEIIPKKNISVEQFELSNLIDGYDDFSKKILGDNYTKISETVYESEKGRMEYQGDKFIYTTNFWGTSIKDEEMLIKNLSEMGFELYDYTYSNYKFNKKINKLNIFNNDISIEITDGNKLIVSGVWFDKNKDFVSNKVELKPITTVLIDFLSMPEKTNEDVEIINLELGYVVYDVESYHKSIVPIPVWKIELSNGKFYYLDARAYN